MCQRSRLNYISILTAKLYLTEKKINNETHASNFLPVEYVEFFQNYLTLFFDLQIFLK